MENNTQTPQNGSNTASIVALVCGIISIVACWIPYLNTVALVLGIVGIIFGVKGRKNAPAGKTGMATAGFVLAIIGTVFSAIGFLTCTLCVICAGEAISEIANSPYYY